MSNDKKIKYKTKTHKEQKRLLNPQDYEYYTEVVEPLPDELKKENAVQKS